MKLPHLLRTTSLVFLLCGASVAAQAQEISQVRGTRALINLSGTTASAGTEFFVLDSSGKRRGLIRIRQVRGDRAVGEVIRGTAANGQRLQARAGGSASPQARVQDVGSSSSDSSGSSDRASRPRGFMGSILKRGTAAGLMAGLAQNTMALTAKRAGVSEELAMSGNSFNLVGFYDYDLSRSFTLRTKGGFETFEVKSTPKNPTVCNSTASCEVGFTYLSGAATANFNFLTGKTRAYVGAGLSFMFAMGKKSSVSNLDTSNATNQMILLGGGADIAMSGGAFIPLTFEYGMFPGSSTVKASSMMVRAGYAWRF